MRIEPDVDLSHHSKDVDPSNYKRLQKTHIRLLASQVPASFFEKFEYEETALTELLDAIYGTMEIPDDEHS